jgi:hypothetical protein
MGIGIGVHLTPVSKLGIHLYARYNPTFGTLIGIDKGSDEEEGGGAIFQGGYVSGVVTGGAVSWSVISLGIEYRMGVGKYSALMFKENTLPFGKVKTGGWRAYFGFRF